MKQSVVLKRRCTESIVKEKNIEVVKMETVEQTIFLSLFYHLMVMFIEIEDHPSMTAAIKKRFFGKRFVFERDVVVCLTSIDPHLSLLNDEDHVCMTSQIVPSECVHKSCFQMIFVS